MEYLRYLEHPELRHPRWVSAFAGWADAQEAASRTVRYLARHLDARRFAELDPEEFYDFTAVRPMAYTDASGSRVIRWPANEFYCWVDPEGDRDLLLFLGTEPSLRWRTYIDGLVRVAEEYGVQEVVNLGSLLGMVPHTRDTVLTGGVNREGLAERLPGLRLMGRRYQGPVGITSVFMEACTRRGIDYISLWGHAPHYVQYAPNWMVCRALVERLNDLLGLRVPLDDLDHRAREFQQRVTKMVSQSIELSAYVKRLERQHDAAVAQQEELPSPETVVQELEDYLRRQRPGSQDFPSS